MNAPGDGPWARRRAAIAIRIEVAALELFLDRGVDEVTVDDIAKAAGISRRTFYRYFETVEHILMAMPVRSLQRMSRDIHARPPSEHLRQAFINAALEGDIPEAERRIQRLVARIAKRSPAAFGRAMGRIQPTVYALYEKMIADRLEMSGDDPSVAPLMAAVLVAVINQVSKDFKRGDEFRADATLLERALNDLADTLGR